jgi:hypothetical protein
MALASAVGPLRTFAAVCFLRATICADRVRRCPAVVLDGAVSAALRLPCAARLEGVPHNSLRSLRSLRSNRMRQVSSRSSLRSPPSRLRCSAPHTARPPGTACRSGTWVACEGPPPPRAFLARHRQTRSAAVAPACADPMRGRPSGRSSMAVFMAGRWMSHSGRPRGGSEHAGAAAALPPRNAERNATPNNSTGPKAAATRARRLVP